MRITVSGDRSYVAEAMPEFRTWLIAHEKLLAAAAGKVEVDEAGLAHGGS